MLVGAILALSLLCSTGHGLRDHLSLEQFQNHAAPSDNEVVEVADLISRSQFHVEEEVADLISRSQCHVEEEVPIQRACIKYRLGQLRRLAGLLLTRSSAAAFHQCCPQRHFRTDHRILTSSCANICLMRAIDPPAKIHGEGLRKPLEEPAIPDPHTGDAETSFTAVLRWPSLELFTFGEFAFRSSWPEKSCQFEGARVVVRGDPVCDVLGQLVGFHHHEMVPILDLHSSESKVTEHEVANMENVSAQNVHDQPKLTSAFAREGWARHLISSYTAFLKDGLIRQKGGSTSEWFQAYRMCLLTEEISYVDGDVANVKAALQRLNSEQNPMEPQHPLFENRLEHVLTVQFFTPARLVSRALNGIDRRIFGFDVPPWDSLKTWRIDRQGINHNVHLIKDADNNGYLTFQGSANLGTYLDIHSVFRMYDPKKEKVAFSATVDDPRWEAIDLQCLQYCHTGLCKNLRAFMSTDQFPTLAKAIAELSSVTLVGHSSGGALASMFAMSVQKAKDRQKVGIR